MPYGGLHHDPQAVAEEVFAPVLEDVPELVVTPEELIAARDTVVVVARYTGLAKATGKRLDLPVVHVWDVRDGRIARFRQFVVGRDLRRHQARRPHPRRLQEARLLAA